MSNRSRSFLLYSVIPAFLAVSVLLGTLAYSSGSLIPGILAHFGLDIFNFSYWWTDVAGRFDHRPISVTGVDGHFLAWASVFIVSVGLFFFAVRKARAARERETRQIDPTPAQ